MSDDNLKKTLLFAYDHINDEGVAGVLARSLATICDPDIYVVHHVADRPPFAEAEAIVRELAIEPPFAHGADEGEMCGLCDGDQQRMPGYSGPLDVPASERASRWEFVHNPTCLWLRARSWVERTGDRSSSGE